MAGAILREARTGPDELWDGEAIEAALAGEPALCVLANPNNPTGRRIPAEAVRHACAGRQGTFFVVDEAFAAFATSGTSLLGEGPPPANAVVVRSLTKELGLPGLRMGYLVAAPELAAQLAGVLPAWPLATDAIDAAVAGLRDHEHLRRGAEEARRQVAAVADALRARGLRPLPTDANYLLCHAPGLVAHLAAAGIAVRDCASFGLHGHVRIAAPRPEDAPAVLAAIQTFDPPA
jgi:histidinol-phosphate/aromatic aminotransferase/cobyric acid decarboxylase-like protein